MNISRSSQPLAAMPHYDRMTIALHWIVALAVILTYGIGLLREAVPRGPWRDLVTTLHVSFGLIVLLGALSRLAWRGSWGAGFRRRDGDRLLSFAVHVALYAGMVAVPVVGMLMLWLKGRGIPVFGFYELASPLAANRTMAKLFEEGHELAAHGLLLLAAGHAVASLFHQYVLRDGVLGRMIP